MAYPCLHSPKTTKERRSIRRIQKKSIRRIQDIMEIKKQWMTHGIDADMEYDPSDVDFVEWIALKFRDDEEVLTDKELYDLERMHVNAYDEVAEIFRIETNIFDFETPLCKALNEFNYLLKIDTNLLTHDIPGFKTYDKYKNAWIYEWDKDVPWVPEEPWSKNRVPYEIIDHFCVPLHEDVELKSEALMKKEESQDLCSFDVEWEDFEHANHIRTNANYNPIRNTKSVGHFHYNFR
ncbi:hypothetical protein Tco_0158591 [Tanacetum coccineum]